MAHVSHVILKGTFTPAFLCRLLIILCLAVRTMQEQQPVQTLDDEVWEHGDLDEINNHLHCSDDPRVINHSTETWKFLQSTYESIVKDESSLPPGGFLGLDGFYVPYKIVEQDEEDGSLVLVATKPIPKGTLIWKSIRTARFQSSKDYRQFLRQLPPALGCDVLKWAYTRWDQHDMVACVDFDPGTFIKECNTNANDHEHDCNLQVASPRGSGCKLQFVAQRDIAAGEEFRMDYSFSEMDPGWTIFGMWRREDQDEEDDEDEESEDDDEVDAAKDEL